MSRAYAACGTVAILDGPLPFGDIIAAATATVITIGILDGKIPSPVQTLAPPALSIPKDYPALSLPKVQEEDEPVPLPKSYNGATYYHVTTPSNAAAIISTKIFERKRLGGRICICVEDKTE